MLVAFPPVSVADTIKVYGYDFVAPLNFPEIVFLQINEHLLLLPTV